MAETAKILEPMVDEPQVDTPPQEPTPDPNKQKRDAIIVQLYKKGASKKEIQAVVDHFKTLPTQPVQQPQPAQPFDPMAATGLKPMEDEAFQKISQEAQDKHNKAVDEANKTVNSVIHDDNVLKPLAHKMLVEQRQQDLKDQAGYSLNKPGTDHPVNIPTQFGLPVQPNEVDDFSQAIKNDPALQIKTLVKAKNDNPAIAKKVDKALYLLQSNKRATTATKQYQIADNADKIEKGELVYKPQTGELIKPEDLGESFHTAAERRNADMELFDLADNGRKEDLIKKLNDLTKESDPDNAVPTPQGLGHIGEFAGGQGKVMSQVLAAQTLNAIPVLGTAGAESVSAGLFAHEFGRRGYSNELVKSYAAFKKQGLSDSEAVDKAQEQAVKAMRIDAATAAAMGVGTSGVGSKLLKSTPASEAMVNAINANKLAAEGSWYRGAIKSSFEHLKSSTPAGIGNSLLAGGGQLEKNITANQGGENRDLMEGVPQAAGEMLKLHYTMASAYLALSKLNARGAASDLRQKLQQGFTKLSIDDVKTIGDQQVKEGLITPAENAANIAAIEKQKETDSQIPAKVKNDEVRMQLHKWVEKREAAAEEAKRVTEAFKEPLKLKIEGYDNKIAEIANSPEAKEETPNPKPKITVSTPNIVNIKLKSDALQEPQTGGVFQSPQEGIGGKEVKNPSEDNLVGISHAQTDAIAEQLGLDTYSKDPETLAQWDEQAKERFTKDPQAMNKVMQKLRNGEGVDKVETRMMLMHMADLMAKYDKNPTSEKLAEIKRTKDLFDISGREKGKELVARKGSLAKGETLADYHLEDVDFNKGAPLTEKQTEQSTKEFNEIKSAKEQFEQKAKLLEQENAKLKADKAVKKVAAETKKGTKKTSEDYAKERKDIIAAMRADLLKVAKGGGGAMSSVPGAAQLAAIAPHVAKMVKSLVEEGVNKLEDVVKNIHGQLKDVLEGISEKDIHNIIAGEYNEKKATKNELQAKAVDIKTEAKLINEYEKLLAGGEPKSEKKKVARNQRIEELQSKIKDFKKENPDYEGQLKAIKTRSENELKKVQEKIAKGDFGPDEKHVPILENEDIKKKFSEIHKEAQAAKDALTKVKIDRHVRQLKQEYANRSGKEKAFDNTIEVLNTPRTVMSSMDFSAPLRQGLIPTVAHPTTALKAASTMFQHAFSQKAFDRWFIDVRESKDFPTMEKSGLYVADPHDLRLTVKEEAFMNNLAEKIPVIGKLIKGSERAYVSYLNKMRVDLFRQGEQLLKDQGKTIQNSEKDYEGLARWVNTSTGRGDLGKTLETAAPVLNAAFFSPRLIASRINALNPLYYAKLPKEVRIMALKDMGKLIAFGTAVLGLARMNGATVETDPRSTDFGKIVVGNTRYDIWGGFQQYIRLFAQMFTGQKKNISSGKIKELDGKGAFGEARSDVAERFARGKLAPVPSMAWDFLSGRTTTGDKVTVKDEAMQHLLPLIYSDVTDAWKDQGFKALFTVGLPSTFGVGVQTYTPKAAKTKERK